jgi:alkylated DNA repair dioxygenase AlkB
LVKKVAEKLHLEEQQFAELLVTEYPAGSVINWHRDAPPFDLIAGVSLHSDCTFRLRPYEKAEQNRKSIISLKVARRSLYVISGPSRTEWQHSIAPVKGLRYSITLRTLR